MVSFPGLRLLESYLGSDNMMAKASSGVLRWTSGLPAIV